MDSPKCCGVDSVWVDHGPRLQYWYCKECKNEVNKTPDPIKIDSNNDDNEYLHDPYWFIPVDSATNDDENAWLEAFYGWPKLELRSDAEKSSALFTPVHSIDLLNHMKACYDECKLLCAANPSYTLEIFIKSLFL